MSSDEGESKRPNWMQIHGIKYGRIPEKILELDLSLSEFRLAVCLSHHFHYSSETSFTISFEQMKKISRLSNGSVTSAILGLQRAGILKQDLKLTGRRRKNEYTWNVHGLRKNEDSYFQNLERYSSKKWKDTFPKYGEQSFQNLESLYIKYFSYILLNSFRVFFEEKGPDGKPACFNVKLLPKKKAKKDGEDSPSTTDKPVIRKIPRLKFWEMSLKRVLKDGGLRHPWCHIYAVIMATSQASGGISEIRWPYRYIKLMIADGEMYHTYRKDMSYPVWLESDGALFDYLRTDPDFPTQHTPEIGVFNTGGGYDARSAEVH